MNNLQSQQQQMFNQTPQTQFQQPPNSGDKRNFNGIPFQQQPQQQSQQQQQFQSPVINNQQTPGNLNNNPQQQQQQGPTKFNMTPSQSFNNQLPNNTRPGLQRNANFSGSPTSSQSIQTNGQQQSQKNGNTLQKPNNPNQSNNNSQGHTPIIGNQQPPPQNSQQIQPQTQIQPPPPNQQQNRINPSMQQSPMYQQQPPPPNQFNNFAIPPNINLANLSPAQRQMLVQQQQMQQQQQLQQMQQQQQQQQLQQTQPPQQQIHPQQQIPKQIPQQMQQGPPLQNQQPKPNEMLQQQELNTRIIKRNLGNAAAMRVLDFIDFITNETFENIKNLEFWQRVIPAYFLSNSTLKLNFTKLKDNNQKPLNEITGLNFSFLKSLNNNINSSSPPNSDPNHFELSVSSLPHFLTKSIENSQLKKFQIFLPNLKFQVLNNGSVIVISKLELHFTYNDESITKLIGGFKVLMSRDLRIEWMDLEFLKYESLFNFSQISSSSQQPINKIYENSITKQNELTFGLNKSSIRNLQINDTLCNLKQLMEFSQLNNIASPQRALEILLNNSNGPPQPPPQQQQQQPPQNRNQPINKK
ncbi:hypothetical protein KGF54_003374 [Candida jiufengensis]|uniref:uncharacterized protein n=1 Tax=Candida jiufengensis TaxID=497108 RepID=UPI0022249BFA|nr:uncharacterized protein KGF54_003374 [Candida jiufengensis]KAI5952507.1 hypothetical protein KGF54_003374 [Candida jiufengensis]